MQDTLWLAWIALRLVFACFGDFGPRSAFGIVRSAFGKLPLPYENGGRPISVGGAGESTPGKILKV